MATKRHNTHQLGFAFGTNPNGVVLSLGQTNAQRIHQQIFEHLSTGELLLEPAGEVADITLAQDLIKQIGRKLHYPEQVKIAQLHNVERDFVGFSCLLENTGWIVVNAHAEPYERLFRTYLLAASLGLRELYASEEILANRAERLIFDVFLPENEVRTFFHKSILKFSPVLAADVADFFKLPFGVILKRALQLEIITDNQYRQFTTVKPHRPKKARPLFVSSSGEINEEPFDMISWATEF